MGLLPAPQRGARGGRGWTPYRELTVLASVAWDDRHELNGRLLLAGSKPLREHGIGDVADIAYAHLVMHTDQKGRQRIDALIAGQPDPFPDEASAETAVQAATEGSSALAAVNEMRAMMGQPAVTGLAAGTKPRFDPAAPKMPSQEAVMTEMDLVNQMRERMGKGRVAAPRLRQPTGEGTIRI